jgi:hypothetical protein
MKKISPLIGTGLGIGMLCLAMSTSFARSHMRQGNGGGGSGRQSDVLGLCWTDPESSSGSTTPSSSSSSGNSSGDAVSAGYGVVFELERGNGNEIAADIYSLDENRQRIKQVGHADVTSTVADNGEATFTSASDSPSQFSMTISREEESSSQYDGGDRHERGTIVGQLANAVLFTSEAVTNVTMRCRAVSMNQLPISSPSNSPGPSPSSSSTE